MLLSLTITFHLLSQVITITQPALAEFGAQQQGQEGDHEGNQPEEVPIFNDEQMSRLNEAFSDQGIKPGDLSSASLDEVTNDITEVANDITEALIDVFGGYPCKSNPTII